MASVRKGEPQVIGAASALPGIIPISLDVEQ
jgi:hypothetical protein